MIYEPINVGQAPNDHTGDPLRIAFQKTNAIIENMHTEPKVMTVAADGEANPENYDFATFEEAMTYAEAIDYLPGAWLFLELADGTHYIERDPHVANVGGNGQGAYNLNHINIGFIGSDKNNCTLTFKPGVISGNYGLIIRAFSTRMSFYKMTIDFAAGGHDSTYSDQTFLRHDNCYVYVEACNIFGFQKGKGHAFTSNTPSTLYVSPAGTSFRKLNSISFFFNANVVIFADVDECKFVVFNSKYYPTINLVSLNITAGPNLDHIAYNSDNDSNLDEGEFLDTLLYRKIGTPSHFFFGNWAGTTANRPTNLTKAAGQPYFDTELGKPIWYDGTQWVDATGTGV